MIPMNIASLVIDRKITCMLQGPSQPAWETFQIAAYSSARGAVGNLSPKWEFPGGKGSHRRNFEQALSREHREELRRHPHQSVATKNLPRPPPLRRDSDRTSNPFLRRPITQSQRSLPSAFEKRPGVSLANSPIPIFSPPDGNSSRNRHRPHQAHRTPASDG